MCVFTNCACCSESAPGPSLRYLVLAGAVALSLLLTVVLVAIMCYWHHHKVCVCVLSPYLLLSIRLYVCVYLPSCSIQGLSYTWGSVFKSICSVFPFVVHFLPLSPFFQSILSIYTSQEKAAFFCVVQVISLQLSSLSFSFHY